MNTDKEKSAVGAATPATERVNDTFVDIINYSIAYNIAFFNHKKCPTYMNFVCR